MDQITSFDCSPDYAQIIERTLSDLLAFEALLMEKIMRLSYLNKHAPETHRAQLPLGKALKSMPYRPSDENIQTLLSLKTVLQKSAGQLQQAKALPKRDETYHA